MERWLEEKSVAGKGGQAAGTPERLRGLTRKSDSKTWAVWQRTDTD